MGVHRTTVAPALTPQGDTGIDVDQPGHSGAARQPRRPVIQPLADDEEYLRAGETADRGRCGLEGVGAGAGRQDQDHVGHGASHLSRDVVEGEDRGADLRPRCCAFDGGRRADQRSGEQTCERHQRGEARERSWHGSVRIAEARPGR